MQIVYFLIPQRREWLPTPVFLPGKFHGQMSLVEYSLWGHKESGRTEGLTLSLSFFQTHICWSGYKIRAVRCISYVTEI